MPDPEIIEIVVEVNEESYEKFVTRMSDIHRIMRRVSIMIIGGRALAAIAWVSTFALAWLMAIESVPAWPAGLFLAFFFVIAVIPSMLIWSDGQKNTRK